METSTMALNTETTKSPKRRAARVDGERVVLRHLTRYDARLIAEELHKLMKAEAQPLDELLTASEAAAYLGMSKSFVDHNKERIPHVKVGRAIRYTKAGLSEFAMYNRKTAQV